MIKLKKAVRITALAAALSLLLAESRTTKGYVSTVRDTRPAPETSVIELESTDGYIELYETKTVKYLWREDRDVMAIVDKSTGYVMKTGADVPFPKKATENYKSVKKKYTPEELESMLEPYPEDLNDTYVGIANSLVTAEYFASDKIKYVSSASMNGAESTLSRVSDNEFKLFVNFTELDLRLAIYLTLGETDISYRIPNEEITGEGRNVLAALDLTPFLGASGGIMNVYKAKSQGFEKVENYRVPGYVLVPDGSGTLIRFVDNTSVFKAYSGDVYGKDYSTEVRYDSKVSNAVPVENPLMPVFGMAHGNGQMAFVAWADESAEYMEIIVNNDGTNNTTYTWAYPRFEYNVNYYQIYDEKGSGFFTQMEEPFTHSPEITYRFLFGNGSDGDFAADYTGMALAYREHLLENGTITRMQESSETLPIRLDFIMGDAKKGLFGASQVVTTTTEGVSEILEDVMGKGITNINSGLIGWQRLGETLTTPVEMKFTSSIGSRSDFKNLIASMGSKGVDVSLSRDTISVNRKMTSYFNTATKAISNWYVSIDKENDSPENAMVTYYTFATPVKAAAWTEKLATKTSEFSESLTLTGITNTLLSNWNRDGVVNTLTDTIAIYEETFSRINKKLKLNLEKPNQYLWKYTDRFLNAPVGGSQYIFETDSVPFLQMVLHGTMEMYAPYSNFSFYTDDCVLRMIDYNLSPSFILSEKPSYLLADTFSYDLYSTEYGLYADLIQSIYVRVNEVYRQVAGMEWTERNVPCDGIVINTYTDGVIKRYVKINYELNTVEVYDAE